MNLAKLSVRATVLGVFLVLPGLTAASAGATIVPASAARQIYSPQISNGKLLWFQRGKSFNPYARVPAPNNAGTGPTAAVPAVGTTSSYYAPYYLFVPTSQPGSIYARPAAGGVVERIYQPPAGARITAFKARAGHVVVGIGTMREAEDDPSSVLELRESNGVWSPLTLSEKPGAPKDGDCGSQTSLLNVNVRGEVIVNEITFESGGDHPCDLRRVRTELVAIAPDGTRKVMRSTVSGWSFDGSGDSNEMRPGSGDWLFEGDEYSDSEESRPALVNVVTGERREFPRIDREFVSAEIGASGEALVTDGYRARDRTLLFPDPQHLDHALHLGRSGSYTWFHLCGDRMVEFSRLRASSKHNAGKRWSVWTRDANGGSPQSTGATLPRATIFETCDDGTAFFHKHLRRGKVRQFSLPLTAAGPTGPTSGN